MGQAPACSLLPTNICPLAPSPSPSPEPSSSRLLFLLLLQHLHLHRDSPHRHQSIDTVHCRTAPHRTATEKVRTYASASRPTLRVAVNVSSTRKTDLLSLAQQIPSNRQPIFPSTHAPITMFRSTLLVAVTALAAVANAQNYSTSGNLSIDATQIPPALRQSWCRGQMIACPQICGGRASANTCDSVSGKQKCASSPSNAGRLTRTRKT